MKPPSPWMGSMMIAARFSAPTCFSIWRMARAAASAPQLAAVAEGVAERRAVHLGRERAEAVLYGMFLAVRPIVRLVRPW